MVSKDESAFLVDFDIAVRTNSPLALYGAGTSTTKAPEQICHPSIANESTDIYSLGCCLYLLLTGHWPFMDELSRLSKPASNPTHFNPKIPDPLIRIVDTCLQKEWCDRYENTKNLIDDLRSISIDELREMGTLPSAVPHAYRGFVYLQGPYLE
jgi:serine/threonine protein kinase